MKQTEKLFGTPLVMVQRGMSSPIILRDTGYKVVSERSDGLSIGGWRYRIKKGMGATTPLSGALYVVSNSDVNARAGQASAIPRYSGEVLQDFTLNGTLYRVSGIEATLPDDPASSASTDFYKNVSEVMNSFKGLSFFAEITDTLRMLKHPMQGLTKAIRDYKKRQDTLDRKLVQAKAKYEKLIAKLSQKGVPSNRWPKPSYLNWSYPDWYQIYAQAFASLWLEVRFGIIPFVGDIMAIAKTASDRYEPPASLRVTGKAESKTSAERTGGIISSNVPIVQHYTIEHTRRVRYSGVILPEGAGPLDTSKWGATPEEILPAIYEATPFSFLADYFSNLGDWITACQYLHVRLGWVNVTTQTVVKETTTGSWYQPLIEQRTSALATDPQGPYSYGGNCGQLTVEKTTFQRSAGEPGAPGIHLEAPNPSQLANIGALVVSLLNIK